MITYKIVNSLPKADCLVIPLWEDKGLNSQIIRLDKQFNGLISEVLKAKDFEGKKKQVSLVYTRDKGLPRLLLIGLGKQKEMSIRLWKQILGSSVVFCQSKKLDNITFVLSEDIIKKFSVKKTGVHTVLAVEKANYSYDDHKTDKEEKVKNIKLFNVLTDLDHKEEKSFLAGIEEGKILSEGVNYTRHLGNVPPTIMTPTYLANEAVKIGHADKKIKVKILSTPEIKKLGMGCLLGVSRGSEEEPKFIIMEYQGGAKKEKPIILVGKGITFDSGGLSLKPSSSMLEMKFDMLGAATIMGIIKIASQLNLKKNLIVLIPSAENMPGGNAYRPDDILMAMNGKTVEIENTDAEGRLILADALSYAKKYEPKEVIDFATLTGACMVAIGTERSGLFTPEENISKKMLASALEVGEQLWRLPLGEEFSEGIKSEIADIKNTGGVGGDGRMGGASIGAAFLQEFTSYPWAHIDMSSCYDVPKGKPWLRSGANGFGVETMIEYLRNF